ncbi:kininogen-2-like [Myotis myotis]|uniref:kininogen-2-like n=1 Tax=Myotis myotis TaxID=51298 RepID=UPI00174D7134|nr:kininogen-2-like [Myotis myotis]
MPSWFPLYSDNVSERRFCSLTLPFCLLFLCQAEGPVVTSQYDCYGCLHTLKTVPPDFDPVLKHGIEHFNNHTNHSHLFALKEVKRAQREVVSGWNYEVTYLIKQTNCSKENFKFLTQDCKVLFSGDTFECKDHAYVDPQLIIASFSQKCKILSGFAIGCLGCPDEILVDSPDLNEALNHSITKLNAQINSMFLFKIDIVHRATSQTVSGYKYLIEFTARETTCSKESNKELTESCEINKHGEILRCIAEVYYLVGGKNRIETTVKCQSLGKKPLRPCVYKARPREVGAQPTSESVAS